MRFATRAEVESIFGFMGTRAVLPVFRRLAHMCSVVCAPTQTAQTLNERANRVPVACSPTLRTLARLPTVPLQWFAPRDRTDMREIIVPHDLSRGPLVAVRRMLVHSSIAELGAFGFYDRYSQIVDPNSLNRIRELIGPGWMPVELALEHYSACDRLQLSDKAILEAGTRAGDKMGSALLVAGAQPQVESKDRSPWPLLHAFARMGRRIYDGASAQYVKTASNCLRIEYLSNPLFAFHYYRVAHCGFLRHAFRALNVEVDDVTLTPYREDKASIEARIVFR